METEKERQTEREREREKEKRRERDQEIQNCPYFILTMGQRFRIPPQCGKSLYLQM